MAQHTVEADKCGVVSEDGERGGDGIGGECEEDEFEEDREEADIDVVVVLPERDSPIEGGDDA